VMSPTVDINKYFQELETHLESGYPPEEIYDVLKSVL